MLRDVDLDDFVSESVSSMFFWLELVFFDRAVPKVRKMPLPESAARVDLNVRLRIGLPTCALSLVLQGSLAARVSEAGELLQLD